MPNSKAPKGRKAWVRKTAPSTAEDAVWNSLAMAGTQKTRMKKSSESMVQPRKAATKVWRCGLLRRRKFWRTDRQWSSRDERIGGRIADRLCQDLQTSRPALDQAER